jgi:hypothetical protein
MIGGMAAIRTTLAIRFVPWRGMTHQRDIREIERLDDGRKIIGIAIHVVSR